VTSEGEPGVDSSTLIDGLDRLLRSCCRETGLNGAGVSMVSGSGSREPLHATDAVAAEVERLQFTLGEGPCVDARAHGSPILVGDICADGDPATRGWPVFRTEAARAGVRAIFAFPVRVGAVNLGAVDMYRAAPGPLDEHQIGTALSSVDRVALSLLYASADDDYDQDHDQGFVSDVLVHQAAGMVMIQLDSSIEEALVRLRATAYAEGRTVNELAADIIHRRRRLSKEES
jgi:GAF domain